MTAPLGPPPDPRAGRQRFLTGFLRVAVVAVFWLAVIGLLFGDEAGHEVAVAMVVVLIAMPVVRVGWLTVRWTRLGDYRFAVAGVALLVVMASGALLSR